ncbi:MAG: zinc ribbon domain-containing protein [Tindallia sp. MSAO_Bac2]|nr:MAG: zinc ribbon domain-containing protein [Tindallia sp. MSAO_Bac2]
MPLYEYQCKQCEHKFEKLKPISKIDEREKCPKCCSDNTERRLSVFGVGKSGYCTSAKSESCGG